MRTFRRNPIFFYYWANWLYKHHIPVIPLILQGLLFFLCGASVPYQVDIGPECILGHGGNGIVIHPLAHIGRHVVIGQQVTVGGTGKGQAIPIIGDHVYLGAGAKILGPIIIGDSVVVGANAVVVRSIPSNCVAIGVPARIIKEGVDAHSIEDF